MPFKSLIKSLVPAKLHPRELLASEVYARTQHKVLGGPFEGMQYIDVALCSTLVPKLLGIYERELNPIVERIIHYQPDLVIDIGAAEGYFAVGMAKRIPTTRVVAFEMEALGREKVEELARKNGVADRVQIRGKCEPADVAAVLATGRDRPVIICDVEGYEDQLLDPSAVPNLRTVPIVVELHEFIVPGIGDALRDRFSATHEIEEIQALPRSVEDYPFNSLKRRLIPDLYVGYVVSELRPAAMSWLWMRPRDCRI